MILYLYPDANGFIWQQSNEPIEGMTDPVVVESSTPIDPWGNYVENGAVVPLPASPSTHHTFDYGTKQWIDPRTPEMLEAERKQGVVAQIAELETQITPRRLREAILLGDSSFISSIEAQIEVLRATL
ncbi:MAG: hypothetical protein CGW95_04750 [Phenylobacterium zucineum]|nr:MAG: hypothetical protein CGW95_04750 [Phenylobacterium zucineum]